MGKLDWSTPLATLTGLLPTLSVTDLAIGNYFNAQVRGLGTAYDMAYSASVDQQKVAQQAAFGTAFLLWFASTEVVFRQAMQAVRVAELNSYGRAGGDVLLPRLPSDSPESAKNSVLLRITAVLPTAGALQYTLEQHASTIAQAVAAKPAPKYSGLYNTPLVNFNGVVLTVHDAEMQLTELIAQMLAFVAEITEVLP